MKGQLWISDEVDHVRPHQTAGKTRFVNFRDFPTLSVGDQFGFRTEDDAIECSGLIVHARAFLGKDDEGEEVWNIHCHIYMMRAGFPSIPNETWAKLERKRKYNIALPKRFRLRA